MAGPSNVSRVTMRPKHPLGAKGSSQALSTRHVYALDSRPPARKRAGKPSPVHIHLNNVSFVAQAGQAGARTQSEADKMRAAIAKLKPNYPYLYYPIITLFRIAIFLLERIGFGFRLN